MPQDGRFETSPPWIAPGFGGLFESGGRYFIGANVRGESTEVFAYLSLDEQALASLAPGMVSVGGVLREEHLITTFTFGPSGSRTSVVENGVRKEIAASGLRPPRSWWDVPIAGMLPWKVQTFLRKSGRLTALGIKAVFVGCRRCDWPDGSCLVLKFSARFG